MLLHQSVTASMPCETMRRVNQSRVRRTIRVQQHHFCIVVCRRRMNLIREEARPLIKLIIPGAVLRADHNNLVIVR
jgi:hypothetical protein